MTPGTSPQPCGIASSLGARAAMGMDWITELARDRLPALWLNSPWLARVAAGLHLAALAALMVGAGAGSAAGEALSFTDASGLHMGLLMTTGTAAALLALMGAPRAAKEPAAADSPSGAAELVAQMSHELRTPLNAVIGFSEVMLRELHGPLGNARYQEYAHHISESGSRLLKSSEDTLAVTDAMSALMTDRLHTRRTRVLASRLVREAWQGAADESPTRPRLSLRNCSACDIVCEERTTQSALRHLLREAIVHAPVAALDAATVTVTGRRRAGHRILHVAVTPVGSAVSRTGDSLQLILARLLLQTQGATLNVEITPEGAWTAIVEFPPQA